MRRGSGYHPRSPPTAALSPNPVTTGSSDARPTPATQAAAGSASPRRDRLADRLVLVLGALGAVLAFASTVNKPLANLSFGAAALVWTALVAARPAHAAVALRDPVVRGAGALFLLYAASLAWTIAPAREALGQLASYRVLLFPLVFHAATVRPEGARRVLAALLAGLVLTLVLSLVQAVWPLPFARATRDGVGSTDAYVWSDHIRQNIHLSILYLAALGTVTFGAAASPRARRWAAVVLVLVAVDVLLLVKGRTGYVTLAAVTLALVHLRFGARGTLVALAASAAAGLFAWGALPRVAERVAFTVGEIDGYLSHEAVNNVGVRVAFWIASLEIAAQAPWFGHGVDAFRHVLQASGLALPGTEYGAMHDPHNEFLYVLVELGLAGLVLLGGSLFALCRRASRAADPWRWLAIGGVVLYVAAGAFNGMLNLGWIGPAFCMLLAAVGPQLAPRAGARVGTPR